jgi:hypothetical protein
MKEGLLFLLVGLVFAAIILYVAISPARGAWLACRDALATETTTPATIQWGRRERDGTGSVVRFTGAFDAQNRMGALIRSTYDCTAVSTDNGWRVLTGTVKSR